MIVIDASVAAKWLLKEAGSQSALQFLESDRGELVAPAIARIEVANAIIRKMREGVFSKAEAQATCAAWEQMLRDGVLVLVSNERLTDEAIRLAIDLGHTVPDCLYLALAIEHGATLVTADEPLYERGRKAHGAIQHLGKAA